MQSQTRFNFISVQNPRQRKNNKQLDLATWELLKPELQELHESGTRSGTPRRKIVEYLNDKGYKVNESQVTHRFLQWGFRVYGDGGRRVADTTPRASISISHNSFREDFPASGFVANRVSTAAESLPQLPQHSSTIPGHSVSYTNTFEYDTDGAASSSRLAGNPSGREDSLMAAQQTTSPDDDSNIGISIEPADTDSHREMFGIQATLPQNEFGEEQRPWVIPDHVPKSPELNAYKQMVQQGSMDPKDCLLLYNTARLLSAIRAYQEAFDAFFVILQYCKQNEPQTLGIPTQISLLALLDCAWAAHTPLQLSLTTSASGSLETAFPIWTSTPDHEKWARIFNYALSHGAHVSGPPWNLSALERKNEAAFWVFEVIAAQSEQSGWSSQTALQRSVQWRAVTENYQQHAKACNVLRQHLELSVNALCTFVRTNSTLIQGLAVHPGSPRVPDLCLRERSYVAQALSCLFLEDSLRKDPSVLDETRPRPHDGFPCSSITHVFASMPFCLLEWIARSKKLRMRVPLGDEDSNLSLALLHAANAMKESLIDWERSGMIEVYLGVLTANPQDLCGEATTGARTSMDGHQSWTQSLRRITGLVSGVEMVRLAAAICNLIPTFSMNTISIHPQVEDEVMTDDEVHGIEEKTSNFKDVRIRANDVARLTSAADTPAPSYRESLSSGYRSFLASVRLSGQPSFRSAQTDSSAKVSSRDSWRFSLGSRFISTPSFRQSIASDMTMSG